MTNVLKTTTLSEQSSSGSVFQDLSKLFEPELKQMHLLMHQCLECQVPLVAQLGAHLIFSGGKRLRPLLTMVTHRALSGESSPIELAAAVEFIHAATLLHDDVVDESALRRGAETANHKWGNTASILVGDYLFAQSFGLMVKTQNLTVLKTLSQASQDISAGEVLQLALQHQLDCKREDLFKVMAAKTAVLFAAACESGALLSVYPEFSEEMRRYGYHLGMAFQMIDDLLDYVGEVKDTGKNLGDDFSERKVTLPVLLAYEVGSFSQKELLETHFSDPDASDIQFSEVCKTLKETGAIEQTEMLAKEQSHHAVQSLNKIPESDLKTRLLQVPLEVLTRRQ